MLFCFRLFLQEEILLRLWLSYFNVQYKYALNNKIIKKIPFFIQKFFNFINFPVTVKIIKYIIFNTF